MSCCCSSTSSACCISTDNCTATTRIGDSNQLIINLYGSSCREVSSIVDLYGRRRAVFSFEFFPPKTENGFAALYRTVEDLKLLNPDFVSVTWGAGGSTLLEGLRVDGRA